MFLLVLPSHVIGIDDGTTLTYHQTINATCVEKKLADKFGGWELDLAKPIEELEVLNVFLYIIICFIFMYNPPCKARGIYLIMFQITCTPSSHCDYEPGVDPIPVSKEGEVQFSLHLNLLGEPQTVSGPMEIGESLSIQCSDPGGQNIFILFKKRC